MAEMTRCQSSHVLNYLNSWGTLLEHEGKGGGGGGGSGAGA